MTDQPPSILPYQPPKPMAPNFGMRAAMISWLAPLAALLLLAMLLLFNAPLILFGVGGVVLWIIGLISSVMALVAVRRYGPNGIRRPAIIGLCFTLVVLLVLLIIACIAIFFVGGLAILKRPWGNFI